MASGMDPKGFESKAEASGRLFTRWNWEGEEATEAELWKDLGDFHPQMEVATGRSFQPSRVLEVHFPAAQVVDGRGLPLVVHVRQFDRKSKKASAEDAKPEPSLQASRSTAR
ncbi:unnamed protein product [Effrenium voratum]|nr:unnamed protein product [Effrenium voratum]